MGVTDIEKGVFPSYVRLVEVTMEFPNKVAMFAVSSHNASILALLGSLLFEVLCKVGINWWKRRKKRFQVWFQHVRTTARVKICYCFIPWITWDNIKEDALPPIFECAHEHYTKEECKRYELRIFFEEMAEVAATIQAAMVTLFMGHVSYVQLAIRLALALMVEVCLADPAVWIVYERDGFFLACVEPRLRLKDIVELTFSGILAASLCSCGLCMFGIQ